MHEQILISLSVIPPYTHFKINLIRKGCNDDFYLRCEVGGVLVMLHLAREAAEKGRKRKTQVNWVKKIKSEAALAVLNQVHGTTVALRAEPYQNIIGCDGTTYDLKLHQSLSTVTFNWWSRAPDDWAHLEGVVKQLMDLAGVESVLARYKRTS